MAKHMKVTKVIAMVSKPDYIPLSQTIGLDALGVNEKHFHWPMEDSPLMLPGSNLMQVACVGLHGIDAEIFCI